SVVEVDGYEVVRIAVGVCGGLSRLQLLQDQDRRADRVLTLRHRIRWQVNAQRSCTGRCVPGMGRRLIVIAREAVAQPLCGDSDPLAGSVLIFHPQPCTLALVVRNSDLPEQRPVWPEWRIARARLRTVSRPGRPCGVPVVGGALWMSQGEIHGSAARDR